MMCKNYLVSALFTLISFIITVNCYGNERNTIRILKNYKKINGFIIYIKSWQDMDFYPIIIKAPKAKGLFAAIEDSSLHAYSLDFSDFNNLRLVEKTLEKCSTVENRSNKFYWTYGSVKISRKKYLKFENNYSKNLAGVMLINKDGNDIIFKKYKSPFELRSIDQININCSETHNSLFK